MHPILFEIGRFPVYTYGVLLAAAYLLGLQFALVRARARGLDPNRVMDLGIWIIISALAGAKLLLLIVEFDTFGKNPRELLTLLRSGGVFFRRVLLRQSDRRAVGDHLPQSLCERERRHATECAAPPDAVVRGGSRIVDSRAPARDRKERPPISRTDVLGLHVPLRHLALYHRVLPRRSERLDLDVLDLSIPFADHRAARYRD